MQPAASVRHFVRSPSGRYVSGRTWLAFCTDHGLTGFVIWGAPDGTDAEQFLHAMPIAESPLAEPRPRLVDIRRLEAPTPAAFATFAEHIGAGSERLKAIVTRAAVVHGAGMGAALAAGFPGVAPVPYPLRLFTELVPAIAWLGEGEAPARLADELEELHARAVGTTPLVRDLRAVIGAQLATTSLAEAAGTMRTSTRSLQRRLAEQGTTFQKELDTVRVEVAQRMMLETQATMTEIAFAVGCASLQHFGVLFRKITGTTPTRWRASSGSAKSDS